MTMTLSAQFIELFHTFNAARNEPFVALPSATTYSPQHIVDVGQAILEEVRTLDLFSPNELLEDIPTSSLRYLLLPFIVGSALEDFPGLEGRIERLHQAKINYAAFIQTTCHFGREIKSFEEVLALFNASRDQAEKEALSAAERRTQLIDRRRHVRDIDEKIRRACMEVGAEKIFSSDDEAAVRQLWYFIIERCLFDALANMDMIDKEMPMLIQFQSKGAAGGDPVLKVDGDGSVLTKPFIIKINNTAELLRHYRDRVFKPGYILPSISLAEAAAAELDMEVNRLGRAQKSTVTHYQGDGYCTCADPDACDAPFKADSEDDEVQEKARNWDDWKDENPRGSGNTMVNRG